jgi:hypothetical protein
MSSLIDSIEPLRSTTSTSSVDSAPVLLFIEVVISTLPSGGLPTASSGLVPPGPSRRSLVRTSGLLTFRSVAVASVSAEPGAAPDRR